MVYTLIIIRSCTGKSVPECGESGYGEVLFKPSALFWVKRCVTNDSPVGRLLGLGHHLVELEEVVEQVLASAAQADGGIGSWRAVIATDSLGIVRVGGREVLHLCPSCVVL